MSELEITTTAIAENSSQEAADQSVNAADDPTQVQAEVALEQPEAETGKSISKRERTRTSNAFTEALETPQGQSLATGLITAVVVAVLFFFAITPALSSITRQLEVNKDLRARITEQETKRNTLNSLAAKENTYSAQYDEFSQLFGDSRHQAAIYQELLKLAEDNRMSFRSMSVEVARPDTTKYEQLPTSERLRYQTIRVSVYGRLTDIDEFIAALEGSKRIMDIIDVAVNSDEEDVNTAVVDLTLNTLYWEFETT